MAIVKGHRPQPLPDKALAEITSIVRKRWGESNEQTSLLPAWQTDKAGREEGTKSSPSS